MGTAIPGVGRQAGGGQARGYARPTFAFGEGPLTPEAGSRVGVVILAAGRGSRFGPVAESVAPKTVARLGPRPLVAHAVAAATTSGLRPLVVVVGYEAATVAAAVGSVAEVVENPDWAEGMATSLRAGLAVVVADPSVTAVTVALADQPRIGAEAHRRLAAAHREGAELAVATYAGVRSHPVLIGRSYFDEAMRLRGDEGARSLLVKHAVVEVPCDGTGDALDVDTPDDLAALEGL